MSRQDFARLFEAQYDSYGADIPLWHGLAKSYGEPILELGCGPGRVLLSLGRAGFHIAGVDDDAAMLARAREKIRPDLQQRVSLLRADLRRLPLSAGFRLALAPCHTMAYFDDPAASECLRSVHGALQAGGGLALDLPSPELEGIEAAAGVMDTFHEPQSDIEVQVSAQQRVERSARRVHVTWFYDEMRPDGRVRRTERAQTYHLRSQEQVEALLDRAGFELLDVRGNYAGAPFSPHSESMLVVAEKRP